VPEDYHNPPNGEKGDQTVSCTTPKHAGKSIVVGTVGRALIAYNGLIHIPKLDPFNGDHSYFCRSAHLKNRIIHPWYHFFGVEIKSSQRHRQKNH
jgi:hypothetical protein